MLVAERELLYTERPILIDGFRSLSVVLSEFQYTKVEIKNRHAPVMFLFLWVVGYDYECCFPFSDEFTNDAFC